VAAYAGRDGRAGRKPRISNLALKIQQKYSSRIRGSQIRLGTVMPVQPQTAIN
jgi:hypothetical protein